MESYQPDAVWVDPDGGQRAARLKGGPLYEWFHGIRRQEPGELGDSRADLARAYTLAVWAYRCIKLRADAVAGVPLRLVDRSGARIEAHPLLDLLRDVNPYTMNLGDLLRATEAAYNIWGAAYWLKTYNGHGRRVRALYWLNPQTVEPVIEAGGVRAYRQTIGVAAREHPAEDVIVFRNFDPLDDLGGLSPLSVALSEINAELNAARFVAAFFANDARPAGLLTTDQPLHEADLERAQAWWSRLFRGAGNKWRTGIVGGGLKWTRITFPPNELALPELRAEDRRAICAVFGVPPGLAGAWESATYATAREQKASFYEDSILPQLSYYAEVLNWSLLPHYPDLQGRGARLVWDTDSIAALRETASDRARRLAMLCGAALLTPNEALAELGLPPLPAVETPPAPEGAGDGAVVAGSPALKAAGIRPTREAVRAELARWERFAARRVRPGRVLRPFEAQAIPPGLYTRIASELVRAETREDVHVIFGEALEALARGGGQDDLAG